MMDVTQPVAAQHLLHFVDPGHPLAFLSFLNADRHAAQHCDVILIAGDAKFRAHRCVLAAGSSHFRRILTPQPETSGTASQPAVVHLDAAPGTLEHVLGFLYTASLAVSPSDLATVQSLGRKLGVNFLSELESHAPAGLFPGPTHTGVEGEQHNLECYAQESKPQETSQQSLTLSDKSLMPGSGQNNTKRQNVPISQPRRSARGTSLERTIARLQQTVQPVVCSARQKRDEKKTNSILRRADSKGLRTRNRRKPAWLDDTVWSSSSHRSSNFEMMQMPTSSDMRSNEESGVIQQTLQELSGGEPQFVFHPRKDSDMTLIDQLNLKTEPTSELSDLTAEYWQRYGKVDGEYFGGSSLRSPCDSKSLSLEPTNLSTKSYTSSGLEVPYLNSERFNTVMKQEAADSCSDEDIPSSHPASGVLQNDSDVQQANTNSPVEFDYTNNHISVQEAPIDTGSTSLSSIGSMAHRLNMLHTRPQSLSCYRPGIDPDSPPMRKLVPQDFGPEELPILPLEALPVDDSETRKPLCCSECNRLFYSMAALCRHARDYHDPARPYPCPVCHRRFLSKFKVWTHCQAQHSLFDSDGLFCDPEESYDTTQVNSEQCFAQATSVDGIIDDSLKNSVTDKEDTFVEKSDNIQTMCTNDNKDQKYMRGLCLSPVASVLSETRRGRCRRRTSVRSRAATRQLKRGRGRPRKFPEEPLLSTDEGKKAIAESDFDSNLDMLGYLGSSPKRPRRGRRGARRASMSRRHFAVRTKTRSVYGSVRRPTADDYNMQPNPAPTARVSSHWLSDADDSGDSGDNLLIAEDVPEDSVDSPTCNDKMECRQGGVSPPHLRSPGLEGKVNSDAAMDPNCIEPYSEDLASGTEPGKISGELNSSVETDPLCNNKSKEQQMCRVCLRVFRTAFSLWRHKNEGPCCVEILETGPKDQGTSLPQNSDPSQSEKLTLVLLKPGVHAVKKRTKQASEDLEDKPSLEAGAESSASSSDGAIGDAATEPGPTFGSSHVCPKCEVTFKTSYEFDRHRELFCPFKPFRCPDCFKAYRTNFRLWSHWQSHHALPAPYVLKRLSS
uniref:zinc finger and BTB domain-containing protein 21-like n=2 Tax=Myxine glutinosa TaxID=7769 RepID=UPI00358E89C6